MPTCMHAFRYGCPCAIRRFSRRCRFAHGCSARCALNHSGGSASKRCLMTIRTFRSLRWVSLTTGGNTPSGSSCLLNVGVCGHHNLHADADAALRTASNRVSGVTTRFVAPTVRILRLDVVKTNGHCDKWVWQSSVTLLAPERFALRSEVLLDTKRGRFVAVVLRNGRSHRLQHDCGNLVWQ